MTGEQAWQEGYAAAKRWLVESESETERASLAAAFASGLTTIVMVGRVYPTLLVALGAARAVQGGVVDFARTPWLRGFRDAVVRELSEPG